MLALYCMAGIIVLIYVPAGIYPYTGLAALVPVAFFTWMIGIWSVREAKNPVPVTALGVMMHTSTCLVIAVTLLFS
jgi:hypothetical protein